MIVESMLTNVWMNAGLGNPPTPFYTNVPESANAIIKQAVNFKESEMSNFALKMAKLIKQQKEDVRGALTIRGPYKLVESYAQFQLTQEKWFSMSIKQREAHESKFDKTVHNPEDISEQHQEMGSLSIAAEEANLVSLPLQTVKRAFKKAQSLLSKENAIVAAPGGKGIGFHGRKSKC